jgi:hypothetical protein
MTEHATWSLLIALISPMVAQVVHIDSQAIVIFSFRLQEASEQDVKGDCPQLIVLTTGDGLEALENTIDKRGIVDAVVTFIRRDTAMVASVPVVVTQ